MRFHWPIRMTVAFLQGVAVASPVGAVEPGIYDGGFTSKSETLKAELRCSKPEGQSPMACEFELKSVMPGKETQFKPPMINGLDSLGGCKTAPTSQWDECDFGLWKELYDSLQFARDHRRNQHDPEVRQILAPLLASKQTLTNCVRFRQNDAYTFCELTSSPWGKQTVLYFAATYGGCDARSGAFCQYSVLPLFKTSQGATLRGQTRFGAARQRATVPAAQASVAPYIKQLEEAVRRSLVVPQGTPSSARVSYQVQFNQANGYVGNVAFTDGCYCPEFRSAVTAAVQKLTPFPLLPTDQQPIIGGRTGVVYLETSAAQPR